MGSIPPLAGLGPRAGGAAVRPRTTDRMAVLFADVSGSTELYADLGDARARAVVDSTLRILRDVLPEFQGRLVKTIGDEAMCVFPTADAAVLAASAMQSRVSAARSEGRRVPIHVGLHFGPVLVEDQDVFGDTVNAAAYLCAAAGADQILMTEETESCLAVSLRAVARRVFYAVLKGSSRESAIYQVLWRADDAEITDVNMRRHNVIPADTGGLLVRLAGQELRVNPERPRVVLGRGEDCDLVVTDRYASRRHAVITLHRTHFYLNDLSINGTFVRRGDGAVVHVMRKEVMLEMSGAICLGRSFDQSPAEVVHFQRDRRALYRV